MAEIIPRPDLLAARRLLAVQPHPDDNEIAAGGLIARLVDRGAQVRYVTVTDGSMGTTDPNLRPEELAAIRRTEADQAAARLGVQESVHLGRRDLVDAPMPGLRAELMGQIAQYRPDFVLTCDPWLPYESHPDHRAVGLAVSEAVSFLGFVHIPGAPQSPPPQPMVAFYATSHPNTAIAAGKYWEAKWQAIANHASQFPQALLAMTRLIVESGSRGGDGGFEESFKVLHPIYLHFNPGALDA